MSYPKYLLMPLSTSGHVPERIQGALSISNYFQAHLEVLHAQVSPKQFLPEDVIGMPQQLIQQLDAVAGKYAEEESEELQKMFSEYCQQNQVAVSSQTVEGSTTACWREVVGLRSEQVAERGKVADMIIIPQSKSGNPTSTFEAAIMRSGKPVMLVPRVMTEFKADRVLIAWNGSTESARAVTASLPILERASNVMIATSLKSADRKPDAKALQAYLEHYDIETTIEPFDSYHRITGEALIEHAGNLGADLMVMGAFTHRRVHEQIFGGVTRYMMANMKIPVLMMH
ncbi:MAG: universal stress protein [Motiliproteus sp.]|nr:universal stress protein [Motiliproteus sp.]MCW9052086.1 universal stress protein [Motiliproteus sp.]